MVFALACFDEFSVFVGSIEMAFVEQAVVAKVGAEELIGRIFRMALLMLLLGFYRLIDSLWVLLIEDEWLMGLFFEGFGGQVFENVAGELVDSFGFEKRVGLFLGVLFLIVVLVLLRVFMVLFVGDDSLHLLNVFSQIDACHERSPLSVPSVIIRSSTDRIRR